MVGKKITTTQIINFRNRFKTSEKELVVKELSCYTNKEVAKILGIDEKYYARLKTKYGCNFFQKHGIEY
jgi:hypothetical protein